MAMVTVYVGLDYHDDLIQVCVMQEDGNVVTNRPCPNVLDEVVDRISEYGDGAVCAIEACCGAAEFASQLELLTGWTVRLAHPGYVKRMKQSPDKSDHDDAEILADLVRVGYLPEVWLAPESVRELRAVVRYRQQLKRTRTETKQQIRGLLRERRVRAEYNPWTQSWRAWLKDTAELSESTRWVLSEQFSRLDEIEKRITTAEQRMDEITKDDPLTHALLEQSGVGPITAITLRAEIGSFRRFRSGKQLARFCGVTPCNASSGRRQADAGLIRAGNRELRTILIEAAHRLARYDSRWAEFKYRLLSKNKPGSVAAAAVANRWIRWLYHQMVHFEPVETQEWEDLIIAA